MAFWDRKNKHHAAAQKALEAAPATVPLAATTPAPSFHPFDNLGDKGFYAYRGQDLLSDPKVAKLVNNIYLAMGGEPKLFKDYLYPAMVQLALYAQQVPASSSDNGIPYSSFGHHIDPGGLLIHSLQTMYLALCDSRSHFFSRGIVPSQRSNFSAAARIACALAALTHDVGKLNEYLIVTVVNTPEGPQEQRYSFYESIPEFLARVHGLALKDVFFDPQKAQQGVLPTYLIKAHLGEKLIQHDVMSAAIQRMFFPKAALDFIADNAPEVMAKFLCALSWDQVITQKKHGNNVIYDIWNDADKSSETYNDRISARGQVRPIEYNVQVKGALISVMREMVAENILKIDQSKVGCQIFSAGFKDQDGQSDNVFFLRFDDSTMPLLQQLMKRVSGQVGMELFEGHGESLQTYLELMLKNEFIKPSPAYQHVYAIKPALLADKIAAPFNAVCLKCSYVLSQDSLILRANQVAYQTSSVEFAHPEQAQDAFMQVRAAQQSAVDTQWGLKDDPEAIVKEADSESAHPAAEADPQQGAESTASTEIPAEQAAAAQDAPQPSNLPAEPECAPDAPDSDAMDDETTADDNAADAAQADADDLQKLYQHQAQSARAFIPGLSGALPQSTSPAAPVTNPLLATLNHAAPSVPAASPVNSVPAAHLPPGVPAALPHAVGTSASKPIARTAQSATSGSTTSSAPSAAPARKSPATASTTQAAAASTPAVTVELSANQQGTGATLSPKSPSVSQSTAAAKANAAAAHPSAAAQASGKIASNHAASAPLPSVALPTTTAAAVQKRLFVHKCG